MILRDVRRVSKWVIEVDKTAYYRYIADLKPDWDGRGIVEIVQFGTVSQVDEESFGNKGAALVTLSNKLNVPDGFLISKHLFEELLLENSICRNSFRVASDGRLLQELVMQCSYPQDSLNQLQRAYDRLVEKCGSDIALAVRSSALCEDLPETSRAGIFDSYINVRGFEAMLQSIKKCFCSLYNDDFVNQCLLNGMSHETCSMGIIVQRYVLGKVSGVMFTADTVQMDDRKLQVNFVEGTCDQFIAGTVQSYLCNVDKTTGEVEGELLGDELNVLDSKILEQLRNAASTCEDIFHTFQDIEWTWSDGILYILQSRSITTFRIRKPKEYWEMPINANKVWYLIDNKPYPPLMMDIAGMSAQESNFGAYITGYQHHYETIAFKNGYMYRLDKRIKNRKKKIIRFYRCLERLDSRKLNLFVDILVPRYRKLLDVLDRYQRIDLEPVMLSKYLNNAVRYMKFTSKTHWIAIHGRKYRRKFQAYCLDIMPELDTPSFYDLVYYESSLAKKRKQILTMVNIIFSDIALLELFENCPYSRLVYERIKRLKSPSAIALLNEIDEYCKRYYAFGAEYDIFLRNVLGEDKSRVIDDIFPYLDEENYIKFTRMHERVIENKSKIKKVLTEKMNAQQKEEFEQNLALAEKAYLTSEEHNYYIECLERGYLKLALSKIATYFLSRGWIQELKDIYYFHLKEIYHVIEEHSCIIDIEDRKKIYELQTKLLPPSVLDIANGEGNGRFEQPEIDESLSEESNAVPLVLRGISGLHATARGKILFGLNKKMHEPRILVLYNGHVGNIVPYLKNTIGLLFEEGSPFDHIGIIAREMGIPAVYYLKDSLGLLREDDVVEIRGSTGEVQIIGR